MGWSGVVPSRRYAGISWGQGMTSDSQAALKAGLEKRLGPHFFTEALRSRPAFSKVLCLPDFHDHYLMLRVAYDSKRPSEQLTLTVVDTLRVKKRIGALHPAASPKAEASAPTFPNPVKAIFTLSFLPGTASITEVKGRGNPYQLHYWNIIQHYFPKELLQNITWDVAQQEAQETDSLTELRAIQEQAARPPLGEANRILVRNAKQKLGYIEAAVQQLLGLGTESKSS